MSFVERFIIQCPYFGGSTIGGSTIGGPLSEVPLYCVCMCVYMCMRAGIHNLCDTKHVSLICLR